MPKWFSVLLFCIFLLIAIFISSKSPPKGDEIHYLLTTHSLVYDRDLAVGNNYENKDYYRWHETELDPHSVTGRDKNQYMMHGLGIIPFLFALPYVLLGRVGIHILLVFLFVLLVDQMYKFSIKLGAKKRATLIALSIFCFTAPLLYYSFVIFPEILGGLLILYSLRKKSILFGLLPWIHLRFLPISLLLALTHSKRKALIGLFLIGLHFAFYWFIYGTVNPNDVYQAWGVPTATGNMLQNLVLVMTDGQYGLFFYSPIYIFAFAGLLKHKDRRLVISILAIIISYAIPVFRFHDWNGGYSPPTRYLVPLLPLIIPFAISYLQNHQQFLVKFLFAILSIWSLFSGSVNLFLTRDYGFVYMNGFSEVLNRAWSITHLNIFRVIPIYYPYSTFTNLHIAWFIVSLVAVVLLTRIMANKS